MEYLLILLILFIITLVLEQVYHVHLYHNRRERFEVVGLLFIVGVVWDTFAIWRGHWVFPTEQTIGWRLGLMPIEEYIFVLVIPYFVLTVYKVIDGQFRHSTKKVESSQ